MAEPNPSPPLLDRNRRGGRIGQESDVMRKEDDTMIWDKDREVLGQGWQTSDGDKARKDTRIGQITIYKI